MNNQVSNVLVVSLIVLCESTTELEILAWVVVDVERVNDVVRVQRRVVFAVCLLVEDRPINLRLLCDTAVGQIEAVSPAIELDHKVDKSTKQLGKLLPSSFVLGCRFLQ